MSQFIEPKTLPPRPCVVMLLANTFEHDTRVYKEARSLIQFGCDVHIVAMAGATLPENERCDGIRVHRVRSSRWDMVRVALAPITWWNAGLLRAVVTMRWASGRAGRISPNTSPKTSARVAGDQPAPCRNGPAAAKQMAPPLPLRRIYYRYFRPYPRMRRLVWRPWEIARTCRRKMRALLGALRSARPAAVRHISRIMRILRSARRAVVTRIKRLARLACPASLRMLGMNVRFAAQALRLGPDVIQAHDLNTLLGAAIVRRLAGTPMVYDSHELFLERNHGNSSNARSNIIWAPLERLLVPQCNAVLSVAQSICDELGRKYNIADPHLLRNVQPYQPPPVRTTILADELDIAHDRRLVIYPGAITINRGLEQMIESAPYLDDAAYVIMGYARDQSFLNSLHARAQRNDTLNSRVFFRDAVPIDAVTRYVASANMGIVPTQNVCRSYFYESSNKIFHCVMAGVPLAMSDHAEKRMLVEHYGIGVLFDETDPPAIAEAVNRLLNDPQRHAAMRRNCLVAARELNWESEEQTLIDVYTDLLGCRALRLPRLIASTVSAAGAPMPEPAPHLVRS